MSVGWQVSSEGASAAVDRVFAANDVRLERAFLAGTARGARRLTLNLRSEMSGAGLGTLGQGLGDRSDQSAGGIKRRYANGGFSASGQVYVRSKSQRTRGALISYLKGAKIRPVRGRWLWIPSDEIQRLAGKGTNRRRVQPSNWQEYGLDRKIGKLELIIGSNGRPLLIVKNVGVPANGKKGAARSLTKRGTARSGQVAKDFVVAFTAIPSTARAARVDVQALYEATMAELPQLIADAYGRS